MSSPFSLENDHEELSDSGSEFAPDQSPCSPTNDDESGSKAVLSTKWMFTGSMTMDMSQHNNAHCSPEFLDDLFSQRAKKTPVFIEHMIIFMNQHISERNHLNTVSISGYVDGKLSSRSKWEAWLGHQILWTPLSDIECSDEYKTDCIRSQDQSSPWSVLGKYGKRSRFRVRCKAFYFEALLDVEYQKRNCLVDGEASHLLQLVRDEFMRTIDINLFASKGADFVLVQCDLKKLADASAGSTLSVPIQGFIQSKPTDLQTWVDWFDAVWSIAPGGLCSLEEFQMATSESESNTWEPIYRFGELKKNNHGRMAAKQASVIPSHAQPPITRVRDRCCTALRLHSITKPEFTMFCPHAASCAGDSFVPALASLVRTSCIVSYLHKMNVSAGILPGNVFTFGGGQVRSNASSSGSTADGVRRQRKVRADPRCAAAAALRRRAPTIRLFLYQLVC